MRFFSFETDGIEGIGLRRGDAVFGLTDGHPDYPGDLLSCITADRLAATAETLSHHPLSGDWRYRPLISKPGKIICVGLNYADHTAESGFDQPDYPTLFPRFASSLLAHDADMVAPQELSDTLDFEGEVAAIIGVGGKGIPHARALDHVAGYALFNDGSVRAYQFKSPQWTVGKNFDGTGAFGPDFVTADELPDGMKGARIETRLNGEVMQSSNVDHLIFDVATLVSTISEAITLEPGDVIVTGTPSGIGHARDPKLYMKPGDVCEVEVDGLGILRNPIVAATRDRAAA